MHQILRLTGVELTVPRARNGARGLLGVGGNVCDRDAEQFREHEADFVLGVRLGRGIMKGGGNKAWVDRRWAG